MLSVDGVEVVYDEHILGVADISVTVNPGEIVAILGANGAGKSTTLKAISGIAQTERAKITKGSIRFKGDQINGIAPHKLAKRNIVHVLEGRRVFSHLTVEENLKAGSFLRRPARREMERRIEEIYDWLPRLRDKRKTLAGLTSGGEQQMLAIGRALLTQPELVLLDEPSMGLAPIIVQEIFEIVSRLNRENGVSFLVAEQNIHVSLAHAHRGYVIANGHAVLSGSASELAAREDLHEFYLGLQEEDPSETRQKA
nr:ABC transporter ATP-binding protein [Rhodovulum imhoffii]